MARQDIDTIDKYDALYAIRTGLTILIPKHPTFDCGVEVPVSFRVSPDNPRDVLVSAADRSVILKDMKKEHLDAALARGVIMFYEMVGDEVVRCTPCTYTQ